MRSEPTESVVSQTTVVSRTLSRVVLIVLGLVAVSRAPYVLLQGRFWAEEGTVYFRHMVTSGGGAGLVYVQPRAGYLNLFVNASTSLATLVPLSLAPLVTAWLAFGALLVVVWVALRWPSDLLLDIPARLTAAALLVVGTLASPEVWLNSLSTQVYLGLLALLLLFVRLDELSRRRFVIGLVLLAVAGLSGPYTAALAPLFVIAALRAPSRRRWEQAAVVSATAAAQLAAIVTAWASGGLNAKRSVPGIGEAVRSVAGLHVVGFVAGLPNVSHLADDVREGSFGAVLAVGVMALGVTALLALLCWKDPDRQVPLLLVGAFVITEVLVLSGSLDRGADGRYAVVPIGILTLLLIRGASVVDDRWLSRAAIALVTVVAVVGLSGFWTASPRRLRCDGCPSWRDQVRQFEAGQIDEIVIWPYDSDVPWVLRLADSER